MNIDETAITGAIYTRCCGINISNPHDSVPAIRFDQESVLKTEVGTVTMKVCTQHGCITKTCRQLLSRRNSPKC